MREMAGVMIGTALAPLAFPLLIASLIIMGILFLVSIAILFVVGIISFIGILAIIFAIGLFVMKGGQVSLVSLPTILIIIGIILIVVGTGIKMWSGAEFYPLDFSGWWGIPELHQILTNR